MYKEKLAIIRIYFLAAVLFGFWGCQYDDNPMSHEQPAQPDLIAESTDGTINILQVDYTKIIPTEKLPVFNKYTEPKQYFDEEFIEYDHDKELKLGDGDTGESKVKFEKFALSENMNVYFEWAADDETYTGIVDCRENPGQNLAFNLSAEIELSYKMAYLGDVDESSIALYTYSESSAQWSKVAGEIDFGSKRVKATIQNFAKIALFHIQNGQISTLYKVQDVEYYDREYVEADDHEKLEVKGPGLDDSYIEVEDYDLPNNMTLTFEWAAGESFQGLVNSIEYGTNIQFNTPVRIHLSYKTARLIDIDDETRISLYMLDELSEEWQKIQSDVITDKKQVEAYITRLGHLALFYEEDGFLYDIMKLGENEFYAKKLIKANKGGTIKLGRKETGKTKIKFKKHDLPEDLEIEFEWAATGSLQGLLSNMIFGPHGTNFNSPVEVQLSYKMADLSGVDEQDLRVYYYNEDLQLWEHIGGEVDIDKKILKVYLKHFSRYAVAYGR